MSVEKLKEIKSGKVGTDLFSILLNEGGDIYDSLGDQADAAMFDDIQMMYFVASDLYSRNKLLNVIVCLGRQCKY